MKIGIIGATGKAGSRILKEALDRGHEVTAIVKTAKNYRRKRQGFREDVFSLTSNDLQAFDVVVNAFGAPAGEHLHVDAGNVLIGSYERCTKYKITCSWRRWKLICRQRKQHVYLKRQVSRRIPCNCSKPR